MPRTVAITTAGSRYDERGGGVAGVARYDWYILRIWRSGRRSGEQWAARLEEMPQGESRRFNQPDLLLDHLRTLIHPTGAGSECMSPDEGREGEPDARGTEPR